MVIDMIQNYLKEQAQLVLPELEWTIDFYTGEDKTGTVYSENGAKPDTYDTNFRFPQYMVFIRSSDWAFAEQAAQRVFDLFHKKHDLLVSANSKQYRVYFIEAIGEPNRLGAQGNVMEWSINFQVTLREVTNNG